MLSFYKLKSHPHQLLYIHLNEVKNIALQIHKSRNKDECLNEIISIICMCHDFGKGTTYFSRYLEHEYKGIEKNHGIISAFFAYWMLPKEWKHLGFFIVKKHHGNMENSNEEVRYTQSWDFYNQIEDIRKNSIEELNKIYIQELKGSNIEDFLDWLEDTKNQKSIMRELRNKKFNIEDMLMCQYIYSLLLTADKSQLITKSAFIPKKPYPKEYIKKYKDNLIEKYLKKNPNLKQSHVFNLRNNIYEDMMKKLENIDLDKDKILSINVPTGTGKTLLAYQAAFYIAEKLHKNNFDIYPHIIYSLPFTSVIDQNYDVLSEILKENINDEKIEQDELLKFHSITPIEYKDFEGFDARFCFENWQSKIISTTFVQLFNTIFKVGKNSIVNRLHKLANSVVIIDEVQVVDEKYYLVIREFIKVLSEKYNMYVILVTATMPILLDTVELIDDKKKYFEELNRIQIINNSNVETELECFKSIVLNDIEENEEKSFLIVLNTVKSSKEVYEYLVNSKIERAIIYLSTEIYPKLRLEKIKKIKDSKEKYIVVSTQLIEAGVDIDMDIVYRDFATLDSINQTSGRANRNGIGGKGIVKLYNLVDENKNRYCNYIYPRYLIKATEDILFGRDIIEEKDIYELNQLYFEKVNKGMSNDYSNKMIELAKNLKFKDFRYEFELIKKDEFIREDIIINADEITKNIISKLESGVKLDSMKLKNKFRILRQHTVSVPKKELKNINTITIDKFNVQYINSDDYDENIGIKRKSEFMF